MKHPYFALGIDQQGRDPRAAEQRIPEDLNCAAGIVTWVLASLALWAIVAAALCAALLP